MVARPDMNLIAALHALLEERSVTRAAERIGVSQPAASAMLARLRRHFGDELMSRDGNTYELTPLGAMLKQQTGSVVELSDRLFATKSRFDPAASEREFVIAISDYALAVIGPALLDALEEQAPQARLRFVPVGRIEAGENGSALRSVDGMVLPHDGAPPSIPHEELFRDEWVCVVAPDEPAQDLLALRWMICHHDPGIGSEVQRRLTDAGVHLNRIQVDSFHALPHFVSRDRRLALVPRRLAEHLGRPDRLRIVDCPVDLGTLIEMFWWHPAHGDDAGHVWLRHVIRDTSQRLDQRVALNSES
ncbi:LysR family transcriptional regulator [Nonomuraea sp. NPDC059023]|uniref:LysR family transcriptional regulator n=1 Tax=unclassified Nonomuraea TaxID=2593643 RepID=UPI0036C80424